MNSRLTLPSPAKLNLFLHITGQRGDGYHTLQTVFQLLDYGDELQFSRRQDNAIHLNPSLPGLTNSDNLVMRAARLLQSATGCAQGADIKLTKRLPMGGGIGGGSSNAATCLLALNTLWHCGLTIDALAALGLQLGADVPVFVRGHSAWAEGVGEQLTPLSIPSAWYLVIKPECSVSTARIFSDRQLTRHTPPITIAAFFGGGTGNDCESVVRQRYPAVDKALNWLSPFSAARLTGTGSCIFARFDRKDEAEQVLNQLPDPLQGFVAKGVDRSPTHTALGL